jgi:DNA-binding protein YbaB
MKSMEEMIKAAQQAAETIQKQMDETQGKLDKLEVEGAAGAVWSRSAPRPRAA